MYYGLIFSRNLNLLVGEDLSMFYQEVARVSHPLPFTTEDELKNLIEFGRQFFPDSAFTISAGMTPIATSLAAKMRASIAYNFIKDLLPIIAFLHAFKQDKEFISRVKANLANLPQFNDTLFELKCLNHFHRNGFSFKYEPIINNGTKEKKPDFLLCRGATELFCECKQIRVGQNKAELQFNAQCTSVKSKFYKSLEQQLFDRKLRLEVNFKRNPSSTDLDGMAGFINELCRSPKGMDELPLQQVGNSIEYLVIPQNMQGQFPIRTMVSGSMRLSAGKPRRLGNPITGSLEGEILFYSSDLVRRRAETLRREIKEAKRQLPDGKISIIIINRAKLALAQQAMERRMSTTEYDDIISFIVNPFDDFWCCYRTQYRELIFDLFEGFQQKNPFDSQ